MTTTITATRVSCQWCGYQWPIRKDKAPGRCPSCHKRHPLGGTPVAAEK